MPNVFILYSREDEEHNNFFAQHIVEDLIDESIEPNAGRYY